MLTSQQFPMLQIKSHMKEHDKTQRLCIYMKKSHIRPLLKGSIILLIGTPLHSFLFSIKPSIHTVLFSKQEYTENTKSPLTSISYHLLPQGPPRAVDMHTGEWEQMSKDRGPKDKRIMQLVFKIFTDQKRRMHKNPGAYRVWWPKPVVPDALEAEALRPWVQTQPGYRVSSA